MKLSDIFNLKSKEGKYLIYQMEQYNKLVITTYASIFLNREGNLESLLDDDFYDAKKSVDSEIDRVNL